jgi:hypothetical protein
VSLLVRPSFAGAALVVLSAPVTLHSSPGIARASGGDGSVAASAAANGRLVSKIAGGGYSGYAVLADGGVAGWGDDLEGQIGSGGDWSGSSSPVAITPLTGVTSVAAGANTAYARSVTGSVWAWGDDSEG